ncbi:SOS response-associated peptidase family protein [Mesorhizobium sp. L2C067A000]|uniref:SOS response-associated peptidase family protein n=1 Tax=Mesorhizobium sp. L2C067A000 TaxID=1287106 RepID=UPI001FDA27A2|nr:SOS response-associated peptidase family protein [Mesorhizobium sp. L2C067A000]
MPQPAHAPFSFAGLWAYNSNLDITSCTIITEPAAEPMKQLHDQQPLIFYQAYYDVWLDPGTKGPASRTFSATTSTVSCSSTALDVR